MKIRCDKCYRVLNLNEEYCTKCGEHSPRIREVMTSGTTPFDEWGNAKLYMYIMLGVGVLLNGVFYVVFGTIYQKMVAGTQLGEVGDFLPNEIRYFSINYSLLVTGIILLLITFLLLFNRRSTLKELFISKINKKFYINVGLGLGFIGLLWVFTFLTKRSFLPEYFQAFLKDPKAFQFGKGSMSVFSVIIIILCYSFSKEVTFRGAFFRYLNEETILSLPLIIIIQAAVATALEFGLLYFFNRFTGVTDLLVTICISIVVHSFLGCLYYRNDQKLMLPWLVHLMCLLIF